MSISTKAKCIMIACAGLGTSRTDEFFVTIHEFEDIPCQDVSIVDEYKPIHARKQKANKIKSHHSNMPRRFNRHR